MRRNHSPLVTVLLPVWLAAVAALTTASKAGPFVTIQGDQFFLDGQVYKLKGTNYYPQDHMWADMWNSWDWPGITFETGLMHDLGLNCVRILVPYSNGGWNGPNIPADRLQKLEDVVNLMGDHGIRSIVTLFDWETSFPASGTSTWNNHITHMSKIVDRLKNNPFVLMWDVKNEPDHPANYGWCDCDPGACGNWDCNPSQRDKIVSWLNRMCNAIRARDPNHPASAGMRWWENLPDVLSFVDVAIFHSYWPNISTEEIPQTKGYMGASQKPIVVEEWGWPTNPNPCYRDGRLIDDYNETRQYDLYVSHLTAFTEHDIAGGLQWMTFDAKAYTTNQNESFENYFGLWRYGRTYLKPAGVYYRDHFPVSPFPGAPPAQVTAFAGTPAGRCVRLSWMNPADSDFGGTMIRFSQTAPPASPSDGTLVCDRPAAPASLDEFQHFEPPQGTLYYSAFSYDSVLPSYAAPAAVTVISGTPGDFDYDGDVDQADFGHMQTCFSGSFVPQTNADCHDAMLDYDNDVDDWDFAIFRACFSGPGVPADAACAE